jgi:deoxyribodipyrimidine photo-lyase
MSGLFIFHRDLRIIDNLALNELSTITKDIIPIFIFNPKQISPQKNKYFNHNSVQFMIESLKNLKKYTKKSLQFFYGDPKKVLSSILKNNNISNIAFNLDYTPFSKERDKIYHSIAKKYNVNVITSQDYTLVDIEKIREKAYVVFNPYYKKVIDTLKSQKRPKKTSIQFSLKKLLSSYSYSYKKLDSLYEKNENVLVKGERKEALTILKNIDRKSVV